MIKKYPVPILLFGLFVAAILTFWALNSFIYNKKQMSAEAVTPYEATLSGEYVCLESTGPGISQTMECAFGIKTQSGEQYALDFGEGDVGSQFVAGETVSVSGVITPLARLSSDHWQKYGIQGIFSVSGVIFEKQQGGADYD